MGEKGKAKKEREFDELGGWWRLGQEDEINKK